MLVKTDSMGNQIWRKQYGGFYKDGFARIALALDGNYIIGNVFEINPNTPLVNQINIIKTDTAGNILWNKTYCKPRMLTLLHSIKALDDGSFIAVGSTYDTDTSTMEHFGWIMKIDSNGDSMWYREFSNYPHGLKRHELHDIAQTPDGGFIGCGYIFDHYLGLFFDIWILKLDSLGCDTPGCHLIGIEERALSIQELEVFPNPFSEIMHVVLPEGYSGGKLLMYDVQGKKAMETEVPAHWGQQNFALETTNINPGIYLLELTDWDGRVWRRKAVRR
jgi:hypothetical protein